MKTNKFEKAAYLLVLIGGLNWGLVGWWKYNLVDRLFGVNSGFSRIIYDLVGLSTLYVLYQLYKMKRVEKPQRKPKLPRI
jgi:uncharacterized protein